MIGSFSDRVVVVTGAGSGIGRAAARRFIAAGAAVVACDINLPAAQESITGDRASVAMELDVAAAGQWERVGAQVAARFGGLDAMVNAAGLARPGNVETVSLADWQLQIDVNLTGTFLGCRTAIPLMRASGRGGSIVNLSSVAAMVGTDDLPGYDASKGGVASLSRSVAMQGAKERPPIRCNALMPGFVDTPMMAPLAAMAGGHDAFMKVLAANVPIGAVVQPEDVAALILFLCSNMARMITGASIPIDGGILAYGAAPTKFAAYDVAARSAAP